MLIIIILYILLFIALSCGLWYCQGTAHHCVDRRAARRGGAVTCAADDSEVDSHRMRRREV